MSVPPIPAAVALDLPPDRPPNAAPDPAPDRPSQHPPGRLIVLEGGDGCGKTTQIQRLYPWLCSADPWPNSQTRPPALHLTKEPGGSELGHKLRSILLNPQLLNAPIADRAELFLYGADRSQHIEQLLKPWLAAGHWILCDRYTGSTVAYQGYGRQLDLDLIHTINHLATGGLQPDLVLWLDLPVEDCQARLRARGNADRLEAAQADQTAFAHRIHQGFADQAAQDPDRWLRISGAGSIETVADRLQTALRHWIATLP